ncbi:DEAD/DEAH box-containing ATP-dependent helicase [Ilumatobacter coccineus]|uniref:Helicase ATP-binding domain-containing protein n=1 Tax=Ilumatobacter coccineus (strain NBRC 103263 / KCTC 29153 / YM16-304) TaxID=1313172 RepID=A0A6C7ED45_ILUCY|nr:hypothetical protein [Ilumatobacter coccineus]BAN04381.1 hypothetical protein YM304_40670 [Ilumatobacter coccineus YM16-304]
MTPTWDDVRPTLKPFQANTVEAVFDGLFRESSSSRFLVADEVGLGKTLVAKGVVAKTIEHLHDLGDRRIDIVYICSSQSIARQNLRKFRDFADGAEESADRLTKLIAASGLRKKGVNVISLTPGTSFKFGHRSGRFSERALLYAVVRRVWPQGADVLRLAGGKRIFYYGINDDDREHARRRLVNLADEYDERLADEGVAIARQLISQRNTELVGAGERTLWQSIRALEKPFKSTASLSSNDWNLRQRVIGELRQILAEAGVKLLRPDLVIMDEFQRFGDLLDPTSTARAAELLRTFISAEHGENFAKTKVLLLSATPYRWFDNEASHHDDFISTLRFLHDDEPEPVERTTAALARLRAAMRASTIDIAECQAAVDDATNELQPVMVRTERLSSTSDRSGMLRSEECPTPIAAGDVAGYVDAQHLAEDLQAPSIVELWKTAPWIANIGDGYAMTNALEARCGDGSYRWQADTLLDIDAVGELRQLDVPSPRLRWLIDRTVGNDWHRLLWLPSARPLYATDNEFDRVARAGITKQMIFSSWRVAPKAIALGVTYAAEQSILGSAEISSRRRSESTSSNWDDSLYRSQDRSLLDLSLRDDVADSLTTFLLIAPFSGLADLVDVVALGSGSGGMRTIGEVRAEAAELITTGLSELGITPGTRASGGVEWYGYCARLLSPSDNDWWGSVRAADFAGDDDRERRGLRAHIDAFRSPSRPDGDPPADLIEMLTGLALASPAICAQRSLARVVDETSHSAPEVLTASSRVGWGFRSLFDSPDSIAIVEHRVGDYWRSVLDYSAEGNLQAVMDEYLHMLREWRFGGHIESDKCIAIADAAAEALSFRTANLDVRIPGADGAGKVTRSLRSRFAVRFGDKSGDDDGDRKDVTSAAFNSPFWPFVMATTSIGQEGLDFHLYSHALVHWNLPPDPVALEQREGRVHRYKGHAVRKNIASKFGDLDVGLGEDSWDKMFASAEESVAPTDGITPYWVFEGDACVERVVPMLPMSREHGDLERLQRSAAIYRSAFGQPRHGDLLAILDGHDTLPSIDLSP